MPGKLTITSIPTKRWLVYALLVPIALLAGALFFEHVMNLEPCQMCFWQRDALKLVAAVAAAGLVFKHFTQTQKWDRIILIFVGLAFLFSFGMAFWHMGVEYKWWLGPKSCAAPAATDINPDDILKALNGGGDLPQCSDAPWDLFGISMAGYNALISGASGIASITRAMAGNMNDKTPR